MLDPFYIGDDFYETKLTVEVAGAPLNFSSASLVRWWMVLPGSALPVFTEKTLTDGGLNNFAAGVIYPVLTAAETALLVPASYKVFVEITIGGKKRSFAFNAFTFENRGA